MPLILQMPLVIFATAIWGLLLPAVAQPGTRAGRHADSPAAPEMLVNPAESLESRT